MGTLGNRLGFDFGATSRNRRKSNRLSHNSNGWIRSGGGFALRSCKIVDLSSKGVRLSIEGAETVTGEFVLMTSRDASAGRRVRVKWRRGAQIGAEFV